MPEFPGHKNPTRRSLGPVFDGAPPAGTENAIKRPGAALTLEEAREKARLWSDLIRRHIDPTEQDRWDKAQLWADLIRRHIDPAQQTKAMVIAATLQALTDPRHEERTFGAIARDWLDHHASELVKARAAELLVQREFINRWDRRPIGLISPDDCIEAVRAILDRHAGKRTPSGKPAGLYQAINAFAYLRQIFEFAMGSNRLDASPMARLKQKAVLGTKAPRVRVLEPWELAQVWYAAGGLDYPAGPLVKALILTGQRTTEIARLSWQEIDLDDGIITIPAGRMKARRTHEVPIAPMLRALLESLPREGRYVFSHAGGRRPVIALDSVKEKLDLALPLRLAQAWILHDLRRTMRTQLSALPMEDVVREAVIAHARKGLHAVYDQHGYRAEKQRALELWEGRLGEIIARESAYWPANPQHQTEERLYPFKGTSVEAAQRPAGCVEPELLPCQSQFPAARCLPRRGSRA